MFERAFAARRLPVICLLVWYPLLAWRLGFVPSAPTDFGLAFNSMAEHLLAGRFDVDPGAIGAEGFETGGRTVSYFGIFCALLRIPLVLTPGFARTDVTLWSCLTAVWVAAWFQIRAVSLIWNPTPPADRARPATTRDWLAAALLVSTLLGGQHIQFLRPSIYQEPINWAFAQAMGFVFLALRGTATARGFDRTTLCLMAACAGLGLLTRVTFGIGLYAAFGLLLLARGRPRGWPAPLALLSLFAILTGIVNMGRWDNPFVFADFSRYNLSQDVDPDRLGRLAAYGNFNPARIWLGLSYYFMPVWIWLRSDGLVLFAETQAKLMDAMELPPGSFFLTDPVLLTLATIGVVAVRDRLRRALLAGLALPPVLMLCAISMAHRYRMEFYPVLFLAALFAIETRSRISAATPRIRAVVIAGMAIGIVASHAMAVLDAAAPYGPGEFYLERYGFIGAFHQRSP